MSNQSPDTRSDLDKQRMADFGISFDGRSYRYHEYRYDSLSDAAAYAEQDRGKPGYQFHPQAQPDWQAPPMPSQDDLIQMAELGITHDGKYYRYDSYRYDQLAAAAAYAQSAKH